MPEPCSREVRLRKPDGSIGSPVGTLSSKHGIPITYKGRPVTVPVPNPGDDEQPYIEACLGWGCDGDKFNPALAYLTVDKKTLKQLRDYPGFKKCPRKSSQSDQNS